MTFIKSGDSDGLIILSDNNNNKALFDFLEMTVVDGVEYAALLEVETDEVVLLAFEESVDGRDKYITIDDDLFDKVVAAFEPLFADD